MGFSGPLNQQSLLIQRLPSGGEPLSGGKPLERSPSEFVTGDRNRSADRGNDASHLAAGSPVSAKNRASAHDRDVGKFTGSGIPDPVRNGNREHADEDSQYGGRLAYAIMFRTSRGARVERHSFERESCVAPPESPVTRASLLVRIRDRGDQTAWQEFVEVYSPVIYGFARKRGLQDADAADLMQDVLRSVSNAIGRLEYDPKQGSFRGWLFTITRNKVFNHLSARRGKARGTGDSGAQALLSAHPDDSPTMDDGWELDYQRQIAALAMNELRTEFQEKTWEAFWRTAVEGESAGDVGRALGMSPGAVYVAKSRVLARLKVEVQKRLAEDEED